MKTIKEQIEILKAFDDGKKIAEYYLAQPAAPSKPVLRKMIGKEQQPDYQFNFLGYHYKIHKEVKPLFPTKEQGAKYYVSTEGLIFKIDIDFCDLFVSHLVRQGRTFYTLEDAEAFVKREEAKTYCLEAINRVNGGDNGFKMDSKNYHISYHCLSGEIGCDLLIGYSVLEPNEYIRTKEAAKELINDAEFVENWKIFKGVE